MDDPATPLQLQLLVLQCQLGDSAALTALVGHFQPRLGGFVATMLWPDTQRLDDVMQDVWADVFHDLPRLVDPSAFTPWLYRIARNRVVRGYRQRKIVPVSIEDVVLIEDVTSDERFEPEDAAAVHAALNQLPAEQREVLVLRFMEELSYESIAAVVSCPVGTVRSRIHNGKRALRSILERQNLHVAK